MCTIVFTHICNCIKGAMPMLLPLNVSQSALIKISTKAYVVGTQKSSLNEHLEQN